jgi:hypothetical protein
MAKRTGITVLNSSLRFFSIFKQDMGIITGQKIVVIKYITKDKNLSSGVDAGWLRENFNQLVKK